MTVEELIVILSEIEDKSMIIKRHIAVNCVVDIKEVTIKEDEDDKIFLAIE